MLTEAGRHQGCLGCSCKPFKLAPVPPSRKWGCNTQPSQPCRGAGVLLAPRAPSAGRLPCSCSHRANQPHAPPLETHLGSRHTFVGCFVTRAAAAGARPATFLRAGPRKRNRQPRCALAACVAGATLISPQRGRAAPAERAASNCHAWPILTCGVLGASTGPRSPARPASPSPQQQPRPAAVHQVGHMTCPARWLDGQAQQWGPVRAEPPECSMHAGAMTSASSGTLQPWQYIAASKTPVKGVATLPPARPAWREGCAHLLATWRHAPLAALPDTSSSPHPHCIHALLAGPQQLRCVADAAMPPA